MDVHVDESGDDQLSGDVDDMCVGWGFDSGGDAVDEPIADHKVRGRVDRIGWIDDSSVLEENWRGRAH